MAERRMFAKSVVNSGRFLRMPSTSRLLYYDMGMQADDDGIVEAFTVMRLTGATEDDLRVLVSKDFVRILNEELVTCITDWGRNNYIQKDRYHPSIYKEILVKSMDAPTIDTGCIQDVSAMDTQDRIGKDNRGSGAEKPPNRPRFVKPTVEEINAYIGEQGYQRVSGTAFFDFYEANGWVQGKGKPIRDWKAAVRTWARREGESKTQETSSCADMEGLELVEEGGIKVWRERK